MRNIIIIAIIAIFCSCKTASDYHNEAANLWKEDKYTESILLLDKAIEKKPNFIKALIDRGLCKIQLRNYKAAIFDFETVLSINPKNTLAIFQIGVCNYELKEYQKAVENFNKALDSKGGQIMTIDLIKDSPISSPEATYDVSTAKIKFERGASYYYLEDYAKSYADFEFCVEKNCYPDDSYYFMAIICFIYDKQADGCTALSLARQNGRLDEDIDPKYLKLCEGK